MTNRRSSSIWRRLRGSRIYRKRGAAPDRREGQDDGEGDHDDKNMSQQRSKDLPVFLPHGVAPFDEIGAALVHDNHLLAEGNGSAGDLFEIRLQRLDVPVRGLPLGGVRRRGLVGGRASLLHQRPHRIPQRFLQFLGGVTELLGLRYELVYVAHVSHLAEQNCRLADEPGRTGAAGF